MDPYQCAVLSAAEGHSNRRWLAPADCGLPAGADEGDFVNLQSKHNFTMAHFGLLLGVVKNNLQELQIQHCNDIFCRTHQVSPPDALCASV